MLVKVEYFGLYPLGADIELNNIPIWNLYEKVALTCGKENVVSPFLEHIYYTVFMLCYIHKQTDSGGYHYGKFPLPHKRRFSC